ncbi:LacI family DNA-binding transcriptional regulator [Gallibacterium trehalosifermentans]|uniref:LacI family DNA-binding transcriptional regulator n=1 Tax=Gallibacterium trehalosifermentans TaxID=516935 RepID=A0ABV6GZY8_9PAST
MKYTIKDIAQLAKVSKSTVSRVLNDDPKVSESTRQLVQHIVKQLNFQPNQSARAMRGATMPVIGIIVTRLDSTAESQTLRAILHELYQQHITPLIVESQFQVASVQQHFQLFEKRNVDGVILFAFSKLSENIVKQWKKSLVTVARQYPNISSVFYDDKNAIQTLLLHFYRQGLKNIAYLGIDDHDETTGYLRNQSYLAFCQQYQIVPNLIKTQLEMESSYQDAQKLFTQSVDVIVCASSRLALGVFKYLQEKQLNIPIACVGGNALLQFVVPNLIYLDFGYHQAGKWAAEMLLTQLKQPSTMIEQRCAPFRLNKG